jgi:hypothetical protein
VKLPGWGTSSPVVYGDRVFVTSHIKDKKSLLTLCIDRNSGKELWRHDFGLTGDHRQPADLPNGLASVLHRQGSNRVTPMRPLAH